MRTEILRLDKSLIITRHAHREKDQGEDADNGISEKGQKQAESLVKFFYKLHPDENALLLSSPKKRCIETLEPLSKKMKTKIEVRKELNEGDPLEFKFETFLKWWKEQAPRLTLICSHGDWIPAFTEYLVGSRIDLAKGGYIEIIPGWNKPQIEWVIQKTNL